MSIIAAILWIIAAIGVVTLPKPLETNERMNRPTRKDANETITCNIKETVQVDGTKITEMTTTSPDGTKTIERTIEKPSPTNAVVGMEQPRSGEGHAVAHAVALETEP